VTHLLQVYYISGAAGSLKVADKRYSALKNQYEMTLNANAVVIPAGDDSAIAKHHFTFTPIPSLEQLSGDKDAPPVGM